MQRNPLLLPLLILFISLGGNINANSSATETFLPVDFLENNASFFSNPEVPIVSNTSPVCGNGLDTVQLISTGNEPDEIIRWYDSNSNFVGEGVIYTMYNVTIANAGDYYAIAYEEGDNSKFSDPSEVTTVVVFDPSNAYAGEDQYLCVESNSTNLEAVQPFAISGIWTGDPSNPTGATIISPNYNNTLVTGLTTGTYVFHWTLPMGVCGNDSDEITIVVGDSLPPPSYFGDDGVCTGELLFMQGFDAPAGATYHWEGPNGFSANTQNVNIELGSISDAGDYTLTYITAEGCESSPVVQSIGLHSFFDFPAITSDAPICMGDTLKLASPTQGELYEWISPEGESIASLSVPGLVTGEGETDIPFGSDAYMSGFWKVRVTDNNGCTAVSDSINVVIHSTPNTPFITASEHICEGKDVQLQVPNISDATYYWYQTENGVGDSLVISQLQNPVISGLTAADAAHEFCLKAEVNGCFSTLEPSLASVKQECNDVVNLNTANIPFSGANSVQFTNIGGSLWQLDFTHVSGNATASQVETIWQDSVNRGGTLQYRIPYTSGGGTLRIALLKDANWISFERDGENYSIRFLFLNDPDLTGFLKYFVVCPEYSELGHPTPNFIGEEYVTQVNRIIFQSVEKFISQIGTDALACASINVTPPPVVNPSNNGGICSDTLELFSNVIKENPPYTFLWEGPNGFTSDMENPNLPFPDSNDEGAYIVTATDSLGCSMVGITQVNLITNAPNQPFVFSNQPLCIGDKLTMSTIQLSGNMVNYEWLGPNGTSTSNGDFPNAPIITLENVESSQEGNYSVLVNVDGCTSLISASHFVKVNENPSVNPTSSLVGQNCVDDNSQVTLFANASGGTSPYNYTWTGSDNFSSAAVNPLLGNLGLEKSGYYSLVVSDDNGCESEVGEVLLDFLEKPNTPIINQQGSTCFGEQLVLNVPNYTGTEVTYHWFLDGNNLNNNSNYLVINPTSTANSGTYHVYVTVNGCDSDTASLVVNINPEIQVSLFDIVLENTDGTQDLSLAATVSGGTASYNYFWTGPNGFISTAVTPLLTNVTSLQSGVYILEITDVFGCAAGIATMMVTITDKPETPIFNPISTVCYGDQVELSVQNYFGNSVSYHWTFNDVPFNNNSPTFFIHPVTPSESGTYKVYVMQNGFASDTSSIEFYVNDEINISMPNQTLTCVDGTSDLILTHTLTGGTAPFTYAWTGPNGYISIEENPILLNVNSTDAGEYFLKITDGNGCESEIVSQIIEITDGISQPQITTTGATCENGNVLLQIQPYTGGTVNYEWYLDGNNLGINSPQLEINNNTLADAGEYSVTVEVDGCASTSPIYDLEIFQKPQVNPTNNGFTCSNGVSDLTLSANPINGISSLSFLWTGPNGFVSTNENPVIPNANAFYSGTYVLTVLNLNGCSENGSTVVTITDAPDIPLVNLISNNTLCEGELLEISAVGYIGNSVEYIWHTPNGILSSSNPTLILDSVTVMDNGNYSVEVNVDGCVSQLSSITNISVTPLPIAPIISAVASCEGEPILFFADEVLGGNYFWTGPNGFNSTNQNPIIPSASLLDVGTYSLTIEKEDCVSSIPSTVDVFLNAIPDTPIAINDGESCEGSSVQLIVPNSQSNIIYTWFHAATNTMVGNGDTLELHNISINQAGEYFVIANAQGCDSPPSASTNVIVNSSPNQSAFAGDDLGICDATTITLNATTPTIGTGEWTTSSSAIISNPNLPDAPIFNLQVGQNIFVWTLSNGDCIGYSSDTMVITVSDLTTEMADAGLNKNYCGNEAVSLAAIASTQGTGLWTQPNSQQSFGVTIEEPTNPNTIITGLNVGNSYVFTWTLSTGVCENFSTDEVIITIDESPQDVAFAGADDYHCGASAFELNATSPTQGNGLWTTNSDVTIISPNNINTQVVNMQEGENIFYWTLTHGSCEDYSSDSVIVISLPSPIAIADQNSIFVNTLLQDFDLTLNDDIADSDFEISILSFPENGTVELLDSGLINYTPDDNFTGTDFFEYQICNQNCMNQCDVAMVEILVSYDADPIAAQETFVPSIITPNGDGTNDAFIIPSLANNSNSQLKVFNRWGDEVYSALPYKNNWEGTYNGYPLAEGSYFYMLYINNDPKNVVSGYLVIKR